MAQRWRVNRRKDRKPRPPLDEESLRELGLTYVGRYATTRAKLSRYLHRKVYERGWDGEGEPPVEALAERFSELGYVDDAAFAESRARSLGNRGYGPRRVKEALRGAGIEEEDGSEAIIAAESKAWGAAEIFARKRRIGPYARETLDLDRKRKAMAAMLRAGHEIAIVRRFVDAEPGEVPEPPD
ncbi:MAG: RecX family transcriptional regulator [Parasphingopyxis sp.]|uniref:regulatory protein RecX n=1 Tax=Parasphingopyxis sp. TaxID=1920299 RepID=UPI0032EFD455